MQKSYQDQCLPVHSETRRKKNKIVVLCGETQSGDEIKQLTAIYKFIAKLLYEKKKYDVTITCSGYFRYITSFYIDPIICSFIKK